MLQCLLLKYVTIFIVKMWGKIMKNIILVKSIVVCILITATPFTTYIYFRTSIILSLVIFLVAVTTALLFVWKFHIKPFKDKLHWYRSILDTIPHPISVTDNNMKWTFLNKAATTPLGATLEESLGKKCSNWNAPICKTDKCGVECLNKGSNCTFFDQWDKHFKVSTSYLYDDNRNKIGYVEIVNEITERMLKIESIESIGLLAAGVAHDFNNMIGGIISLAELQKKHLRDNPEAEKIDDMIIDTSEKAVLLINKLLLFASNKETELCVIDLYTIINDAILLLNGSIDKKIKLIKDLKLNNHKLMGEQAQILSALINLGINASHAMPNGGIITFTTENKFISKNTANSISLDLPTGNYIKLSISDTGVGINNKDIENIFDPFFTTKEKGKGTGLGLAAVYNTVTHHNGRITVESEIGKGTTFNILLPALQE